MEHESLFACAFERVDELLVLAGAERSNDDRLRLTAGKQCRPVRPGQHVHFREDRPHRLQVAPVDALAGLDDVAAHNLAFQILEGAFEQHLFAGVSRWQLNTGQDLVVRRANEVITLLLLLGGESCAQVGLGEFLDLGGILLGIG